MIAKIADKKEIAEGTLWVKFDLLGRDIKFKPGQFFYIDLIRPPYNDLNGSHRHFSIVNSPDESGIIEMATRIRDSAFKKSLLKLPIGSEIEMSGIDGNFVLPDDSMPLVFIAGGIGITPFMSMIRYIQKNKPSYKVILLYSNRNEAATAFLEELRKIAELNSNFKLVLTMTEMPEFKGEHRFINAAFIKEYVPDLANSRFMFSGPPAMVKAIKEELLKLDISKKNIKFEEFLGY